MNQKEFLRRRRRFTKALDNNAIALVATNQIHYRNRDSEYPFRPDSDFYYLTGFPEPEAMLVIVPERPDGETIIFCRERDPEKEAWTGARIGIDGAKAVYGANEAYPFSKLDEIMPNLLKNRTRIYYSFGLNSDLDLKLGAWLQQIRNKTRAGIYAPTEIFDLSRVLHEQRLIKDPNEIKMIRAAARITARAHQRAMQICRPGMKEYQLEAELIHEFTQSGARGLAYSPIVAAGKNACILHYSDNCSEINHDDLVLIDAGCELDYYAADITRTFPANGVFNAAQRQIYDLVLKAQLAAIDQVRAGQKWNEPHDTAVQILTKGLVELGLLEGKVKELIKENHYKRFYRHSTSHWLGMDVHDVGDYQINGQWRELKPGMVLTIEPGIYIPANTEGVPEKYWGIGIRIEDECLVTKHAPEVLTANAPKDSEEIQKIMANKL